MKTPGERFGFLTLDVEDWEHANFTQLGSRTSEIRDLVRARAYNMAANTDTWIEFLADKRPRSTCFVLGEFARRYPDAVTRLHAAGHEIACHGDTHDLIYNMTREQFRESLQRALGALGDLIGMKPAGFRAASWSVDSLKTPWFCDELARAGMVYDSSQFPVRTPMYGSPDCPLKPYRESGVWRIPVTVLRAFGFLVPFSSGAFFRLMTLPIIRYGLSQAWSDGRPVMIVVHPRELDPHHPRLPLHGWESWVHYARLRSTLPKLRALLDDFEWLTMSAGLSRLQATS